MNATLLCPGPSLIAYNGCDGFKVGVNRAASLHDCDVWAATDRPLIDSVQPIGTPVLLTIEATRESLARRGRPWPYLVITHKGIGGKDNARTPWIRFTATAGLFFLAWMGAKHVDVWGCDWNGTEDWDGKQAGANRAEQRWNDEREIWNKVIEQTGIEVTRHGLDG